MDVIEEEITKLRSLDSHASEFKLAKIRSSFTGLWETWQTANTYNNF